MKQYLHKVFSMIMALLVLFSTVSLTVEKHYCGDYLVDVAIFTTAVNCDGEEASENTMKKNCCKDEIEVIQGQDELKPSSFDDFSLEQQAVLFSYAHTCLNLFEGLPQHVIPHKEYSPPKLIVDIQLLDQVFLI